VEKEEQIKDIVHIIASEQGSALPRTNLGGGMFEVKGALPYKVILQIAEQIYHQGYRKP